MITRYKYDSFFKVAPMESHGGGAAIPLPNADHFGSSSWITTATGNANQHLAYLPYGEQFIDERNTDSHDIRFKFTAKERDRETGLDYFGARYYSSGLSVWLSVDALAGKYPALSPYMYTAGNPVNMIDPDGKWVKVDITRYDKNGNKKRWWHFWRKTTQKDINITIYNAMVYNGSSKKGDMEEAANDIKKNVEYYWNTKLSKKGKEINVSTKFEGGITVINDLDRAKSNGTLVTKGNRQSTLFYIADDEVFDKYQNKSDVVGLCDGNLIVITAQSTTIGRKSNIILPANGIDSDAAHEFGHLLLGSYSLPSSMYGLMSYNLYNSDPFLKYRTANRIKSGIYGDGVNSGSVKLDKVDRIQKDIISH